MYTAATVAMRLRFRFSPLLSRLASLFALPLRGLARGFAQIARQHHHALAVGAQRQDRAARLLGARGCAARRRRQSPPPRAAPGPRPGACPWSCPCVAPPPPRWPRRTPGRPARRPGGARPASTPRAGQVQLRIQRVQAVHAWRPVAQPFDPHLAEHGRKPALVQALLAALYRVGPAHRLRRRPRTTAVQLRLEQHPHQLPAALAQRCFQLSVAELPAPARGSLAPEFRRAVCRQRHTPRARSRVSRLLGGSAGARFRGVA